jgi:hypothetical protein
MRKQSLQLDPFSLTRIGVGIWMTDLIVARTIAQALKEQNRLIASAMRGRPLPWSGQIDRNANSRERTAPDRAGTMPTAEPLKRVLVRGESGGHEAFLATPLDGVPVDADRRAGSGVTRGSRSTGFVFQRSA